MIKPFWELTEKDQKACLDATEWCPADNGYFRGGGFSSRFLTRGEMPATMVRVNLVKGLGPVLQLVEGWTVNLPDEVSDKLWKRTDYTWPCTWFTPRLTGKGAFRSAYDVTMAPSATATSVPTSSRCAPSCAFPSACTMSQTSRSSAPLHGTHSAWTQRVRTTAPAPPMGPCISNIGGCHGYGEMCTLI